MSADVAAAVVEQLQLSLPADVTVFDGTIPLTPPNHYVVVFVGGGLPRALAIDSRSIDVSFSFRVMSVVSPPDAGELRWLKRAVAAALVDWTPAADDMASLIPIAQETDNPLVSDESVPDRHVMYVSDMFMTSGITN